MCEESDRLVSALTPLPRHCEGTRSVEPGEGRAAAKYASRTTSNSDKKPLSLRAGRGVWGEGCSAQAIDALTQPILETRVDNDTMRAIG